MIYNILYCILGLQVKIKKCFYLKPSLFHDGCCLKLRLYMYYFLKEILNVLHLISVKYLIDTALLSKNGLGLKVNRQCERLALTLILFLHFLIYNRTLPYQRNQMGRLINIKIIKKGIPIDGLE